MSHNMTLSSVTSIHLLQVRQPAAPDPAHGASARRLFTSGPALLPEELGKHGDPEDDARAVGAGDGERKWERGAESRWRHDEAETSDVSSDVDGGCSDLDGAHVYGRREFKSAGVHV